MALPRKLFSDLEKGSLSWCDALWLQKYNNKLNEHTVYDYFKTSVFHVESNNDRLLQQRLDLSKLESMPGLYYEVKALLGTNNFIVLQKERIISPQGQSDAQVLALFLVIADVSPMFGTIFPLPSLNAVYSNLLLEAMHHLRQAIKHLPVTTDIKTEPSELPGVDIEALINSF